MTQFSDASGVKLDDQTVADFLSQNKDFFSRNPELLQTLELRHEAGSATSLVERQVAILRERNIDVRKRLAELIQTGADNDRVFKQTRALTLALMDTNSWLALDEAMAEHLVCGFEADNAVCYVMDVEVGNLAHVVGLPKTCEPPVSRMFSQPHAACGTYRPEEYGALFGDHSLAQPGSAALIPMRRDGITAALAIGAYDATRFTRDMGTVFLDYIGEVLARTLSRLTGVSPG